jgi:hypothetical protein
MKDAILVNPGPRIAMAVKDRPRNRDAAPVKCGSNLLCISGGFSFALGFALLTVGALLNEGLGMFTELFELLVPRLTLQARGSVCEHLIKATEEDAGLTSTESSLGVGGIERECGARVVQ